MAIAKLNCPECGTVLRPAKPVAPGKKVKCPKCEVIFQAREEDDEEDRPRKALKPTAKKGAPAAKEKPKKKKEEEIYGYIKETEEEEDKKVRIDFAPDETVKDMRGPAIMTLRKPATFLQFLGMAGALGWLVVFMVLMVPTVFPIEPDAQEKEKEKQRKSGIGQTKDKEKEKAAKPTKFFDAYGADLGEHFLILLVPMVGLFVYACIVTAGGIKMAHLESRRWGIAGSVMAMLPLHIGGLALFFFLFLQWLFNLILEDPDFAALSGTVVAGIFYAISLGIGAWALKTLMDETVIEGFEYKAE